MTLPAFAKINLDLRVLGVRPDGYHDLRTIFQSLALHDTLTFSGRKGPFKIECNDSKLPTDRRNLVWQAASILWSTAGRTRGDTPRDAVVALHKEIPEQAGLGGGSADAATALVGLSRVWELDVDGPTLSRLAMTLGADIPFFLVGGTALGLARGDDIYPLADLPRVFVVIVRPRFGVSTIEAYRWYNAEARPRLRVSSRRGSLPEGWPEWAANLGNDLEAPVTTHHPTIGRIKELLIDAGAAYAAMSGSGSAVFGLFERREAAKRTVRDLARPGWHVALTRTLSRAEYARKLRLALARGRKRRIS